MKKLNLITSLFIMILCADNLNAQSEKQNLSRVILNHDSVFWKAYNQCDIPGMQKFFTDDLEFYHDKGGITRGIESLMTVTKKNLCSNENFRLRREALNETYRVFPMTSNNVLYGAILSGEHLFYIVENGSERLDGHAKFTHLWILKDNVWKMSRILSYDHGPAAANSK
jgi:hypothetical protein